MGHSHRFGCVAPTFAVGTRVTSRPPGRRRQLPAPRSGRIEARTGLRMMPTFPRSPYHSVRRVFPHTAGRLGFSVAASPMVRALKSAPHIHARPARFHSTLLHLAV